jgi:AraC family transcriptional regulator
MDQLHTTRQNSRAGDCHDPTAGPVEFASLKPQNVRLTSRGLGWGALNFERREAAPDSDCLPAGSTEHLVFVSLAQGHVQREADGALVEQELMPGCVAVQPGGQSVRWSWDTRLSFSVISLEPAFLDRVAAEVFDLEPGNYRLLASMREQDPVISNIAGVLAREALRADAGGRLYAESLANILAVHLLRNYSLRLGPVAVADDRPAQAAHKSRAVADAIAYLQANYSRDIKLEDMAAAVHASPFHLARQFKRVTGVTPHQYLVQVRVNAARSLLSAGSGQRSLAEVAAAVGFADQSHLTRQFKRHFGVTPSRLR